MKFFPTDTEQELKKLSDDDLKKAANIALGISIICYIIPALRINLGVLTIIPLAAMAYVFKFANRGLGSSDKGSHTKAKIARVMAYIYWVLVGFGVLYLIFALIK